MLNRGGAVSGRRDVSKMTFRQRTRYLRGAALIYADGAITPPISVSSKPLKNAVIVGVRASVTF
jgi:K+ transporter